jgi:hypothetical protein
MSVASPTPGSVTLPDGTPLPQRATTKIETTEAVPAGTNVTVPTANPVGAMPTKANDSSTAAPVVAVNTTSKWLDPQFLLNALLCLGSVVVSALAVLPVNGPINWMVTGPTMFIAAYGALQTWLRTRTNTVTR